MTVNNTHHALERYILGKDGNHPDVLAQLYCTDARLTFSMDDSSMNFPACVEGADEIARVLSADFNQRYHRVKTWYLQQPATDPLQISGQPWLVLMQEIESGQVRAGCGFYNWQLTDGGQGTLQVAAHHIHIHCMLCFDASEEAWLLALQQRINYPWNSLTETLDILAEEPRLRSLYQWLSNNS